MGGVPCGAVVMAMSMQIISAESLSRALFPQIKDGRGHDVGRTVGLQVETKYQTSSYPTPSFMRHPAVALVTEEKNNQRIFFKWAL